LTGCGSKRLQLSAEAVGFIVSSEPVSKISEELEGAATPESSRLSCVSLRGLKKRTADYFSPIKETALPVFVSPVCRVWVKP
jgi:hypothetical protein